VSEWELGETYCKASGKRGIYTPLTYQRPRVPGSSKVLMPPATIQKDQWKKSYLRFEF